MSSRRSPWSHFASRRVEDRSREAFRVDAKAEGECIVIGGWEILRGDRVEKGRWFSIRLNRHNAPWAYLKGEPFRNIASLELTAVLVAVILFGDSLVDCGCLNTLTLSASTDNLGNTYVFQHVAALHVLQVSAIHSDYGAGHAAEETQS